MTERREMMSTAAGFIAALDQSGGSTPKALQNYGVDESAYSSEDEMFTLVHDMRVRIMSNKAFARPRILGAILFEKTMRDEVDGLKSSQYLWQRKSILPFLKIDVGLAEESNGIQLMKPVENIADRLEEAKELDVFGTKMRSVIKEANAVSIRQIVDQQFELAEKILEHDLVPIVEPEVDINAPNKLECERILRDELNGHLDTLSDDQVVIFKLTLPEEDGFYDSFVTHPSVLRVAALSGGYTQEESVRRLRSNEGMVASFSRALTEELRKSQSDLEFGTALNRAIEDIASASAQ